MIEFRITKANAGKNSGSYMKLRFLLRSKFRGKT